MVIESLKAEIARLTEASKEKGVPEKVKKALTESATGLQKLLDKAREAAKEAKEAETYAAKKEEEGEEEAGDMPEEESGKGKEESDSEMPEAGHTITKTMKIKHDKHQSEDGDEPDPKDEKDGDAEESRKIHIEYLLKEAGIPQGMWHTDKLMKMSLKEAKEAIAEKKATVDEAKKAVEADIEMIPMGMGEHVEESDRGENLNSLFTGCAE